MSNVIDFHTHILPKIDDGSKSVAESIEMLKTEASQGIRHIVATPHFYAQHDNLDRFLQRREEAEKALRAAIQNYSGLPAVSVGSEVHYFSGMSDSDAVSALTIEGGTHILIEMPQSPWNESMYRELERLYTKQGLFPIIAHVERYIGRFRTYGIPKRLMELPVLVQANAEFFTNKKTTSMALRMLEKEHIHLLGSDCHNMKTRKPNLAEACNLIADRLGESAIKRIQIHEQSVFTNQSVNLTPMCE